MNDIFSKIRLEPFQYEAIVDSFKEIFMTNDELWLFGSRVNMASRGGDIDLYIETHITDFDEVFQKKSDLISKIWDAIGEQKIDIILNMVQMEHKPLPIYEVAKNQGIKLVNCSA